MEQKIIKPETELTLKIQAKDYQIIRSALESLPWKVANEVICIIENQVIEQVK